MVVVRVFRIDLDAAWCNITGYVGGGDGGMGGPWKTNSGDYILVYDRTIGSNSLCV